MKNFLLEQQQKAEKINLLTEFIQSNLEARELKRALAVKMALSGEPYSKITKLLGMHKSCITTWKQKFETQGLDGIKLAYIRCKKLFNTGAKGGSYYLAEDKRLLELRGIGYLFR